MKSVKPSSSEPLLRRLSRDNKKNQITHTGTYMGPQPWSHNFLGIYDWLVLIDILWGCLFLQTPTTTTRHHFVGSPPTTAETQPSMVYSMVLIASKTSPRVHRSEVLKCFGCSPDNWSVANGCQTPKQNCVFVCRCMRVRQRLIAKVRSFSPDFVVDLYSGVAYIMHCDSHLM